MCRRRLQHLRKAQSNAVPTFQRSDVSHDLARRTRSHVTSSQKGDSGPIGTPGLQFGRGIAATHWPFTHAGTAVSQSTVGGGWHVEQSFCAVEFRLFCKLLAIELGKG